MLGRGIIFKRNWGDKISEELIEILAGRPPYLTCVAEADTTFKPNMAHFTKPIGSL